jgi:hypothetical protein
MTKFRPVVSNLRQLGPVNMLYIFSSNFIILNNPALSWHKENLIKRVPKPCDIFDISYKSDELCSDVSVYPSKGTRMYGSNVSMGYLFLFAFFPRYLRK